MKHHAMMVLAALAGTASMVLTALMLYGVQQRLDRMLRVLEGGCQ